MGASAIGLVSEMPSGPGIISEREIQEIIRWVNGRVDTFLLTSKQNVSEIIEQLFKIQPSTVQIVDKILKGSYTEIRSRFPNIKIVQVLHISNNYKIKNAIKTASEVDALLLDSGNQNLEIKELGGTGKTHDWRISKSIVENVKIPVYLAGGLNQNNILNAIKEVQPFGIDVCSGVRSGNKLDPVKLQQFFNKIKSLNLVND
jgi:phosphoribosylanthranilate isomerase